jgi:hypothetical protein
MTVRIGIAAFSAGNQPDARYTDTVRFSSSDPRAELPADYTFVPADKGEHGFRVKLRTPGSQTVTVTDVRGQRLAGSTPVWVCQTTDLRLKLELDDPDSVTAGKPFGATVNVYWPCGQWTTDGYRGRIRFRCTDAAAKLPADYTWKREQSIHPFVFSLPTPGKWTLSATDTDLPRFTHTVTVTVRPGS